MKNFVLILAVVVSLMACSVSPTFEIRSGSVDHREVEEPLSKRAKKYSDQLVASNEIIELIKDGNNSDVYNTYLSEELKDTISIDAFEKLILDLDIKAGKIIKHMPNQWHFKSFYNNKRKLLWSIKIVQHEKAKLDYYFVFDGDNPNKLIGIHFNEFQ